MKNLLIFIFLMSWVSAMSQIMVPKWETCLGGSDWDEGTGLLKVEDTYCIVAETQSNDGDISYNHAYHDVWFVSVDSSCCLLSEKTFGGFGTEYPYRRVYQKSDCNYVITLGTKTYDWQSNINTAKPDLRIVELYNTTV
jgi:hypothetical protein